MPVGAYDSAGAAQLAVSWGDTDDSAWVFVTDASRSCYCDGKAVYNAAQDLIHQMTKQVAATHNVPADQLQVHDGGINGPGGLHVDFRTIAKSATPRADFDPYFDPKTDHHPNLDMATGSVTQNPSMAIEWQTKNLAKRLLTKGGIVGLGHYIFDPSVNAWGSTFADIVSGLPRNSSDFCSERTRSVWCFRREGLW